MNPRTTAVLLAFEAMVHLALSFLVAAACIGWVRQGLPMPQAAVSAMVASVAIIAGRLGKDLAQQAVLARLRARGHDLWSTCWLSPWVEALELRFRVHEQAHATGPHPLAGRVVRPGPPEPAAGGHGTKPRVAPPPLRGRGTAADQAAQEG